MNISYNWINDYIDLTDIPIKELSDILTMKTCEVEGYEPFRPHLENIVVGLVEDVQPHPDADKLKVCKVSDGKNSYQIVCGAPNVIAGKKYPVAKIGATLPGGMVIKEAKLRGVDSSGMLCSSTELLLNDMVIAPGEDPDAGLLTLPDDFPLGKNLRQLLHLDDYIIEIDNKSVTHRPDLWGHFGIARELAALLDKPLKANPLKASKETFPEDPSIDKALKKPSVEIKDNSAIAYSSALLSGVCIAPSSLKMQARLLAAGMRPINNVVDVSNFVMLETAQPNHAFDREFIQDHIEVSYSKASEKLTLLDSKELILPEGIVLIRDGEKPVALAGVMGGEHTEVNEKTKNVFLESATFHRSDIRATISKTSVRTEASQRFEKGQDPENAVKSIYRFAELLKETCPDLKLGSVDLVETEKPKQNVIETKISYIRERLGDIDANTEKITKILNSLGMQCKTDKDDITITVPVYRSYFDITLAEDLIEEIGRVMGYRNVNPQPIYVSCEVPKSKNLVRTLEHDLRELMSGAYHFTEVYNYAFHSQSDVDLDKRYAKKAIRLQNSVNKDLEYMRISPMPGLLHNIAQNYKERPDLRFYEIERIFIPNEGSKEEEALPNERSFISGAITSTEEPNVVMTSLSSMLADLLVKVGLTYYEQSREKLSEDSFHPGRSGQILNKNKGNTICKWGQIHPAYTKKYSIEKPVFYFEMFIEDLNEIRNTTDSGYKPVVKYPHSDFELTVLMDKRQPFADILAVTSEPVISNDDKTYMESIDYLNTYEGDSIPDGKKAVSIRMTWRNRTRTLEHDEIKTLQESLISSLNSAGFTLR
ncbi:MAG: phenylalanine--tRNA ligase subunit beta [Leptospirales bacterium]